MEEMHLEFQPLPCYCHVKTDNHFVKNNRTGDGATAQWLDA